MRLKPIIIMFALCALAASCGHRDSFDLADHVGVCGSPADKAAATAEAGGAYMEIGISRFLMPEASDEEFAPNLQIARECPLPIISGNSYFPGDLKLVGPEADHERALRYAETALARANMIGLQYAVLGSSRARSIPEGFSREEAEAQFVDLLKRMAPIARKNDVTIVIEPLRCEETNFINSVREGTRICKMVDDPNICVLADFYHMAQVGEDAQALVEAGDLLRHCHIAEATRRTAPGKDGDDFTPYFKALKQIGYKGSISLECVWGDFDSEVGASIAEVKRQIASIDE